MSLEPAFSIPIVLIVGLAAVYIWFVLSQATIGDKVFAYPREHWGLLWNCVWCLSFWTTALMLIVTQTYDPLTHLACAGFAGVVGSLTS
jgi:hypothetical protein